MNKLSYLIHADDLFPELAPLQNGNIIMILGKAFKVIGFRPSRIGETYIYRSIMDDLFFGKNTCGDKVYSSLIVEPIAIPAREKVEDSLLEELKKLIKQFEAYQEDKKC